MGSTTPNGYEIRTYAVEYQVPGALDGATLGPPLNAATVVGNRDPQQLFRPVVPDNLGLIDCDYNIEAPEKFRRGARGNRYISWFYLDASVPGGAAAALQVVDILSGVVIVQEEIELLGGQTVYYNRNGILMPQASVLRIVGFDAGPEPHVVRMHIQYLTDREWILAQQAVCQCDANGNGGVTNDDMDIEFGVANLAGTGANPRFLWPGAGRTIAQPEPVARPAPVDMTLRTLVIRQNNPVPGLANVTYEVLVNGAPVASQVVPTTATTVILGGLAAAALEGDAIALRATRDITHPTLVDVLVSTLWERN